MSRVAVLGAGVVGQTYGGLLAAAGHEVSIVARGRRADDLRSGGLALDRDGDLRRFDCAVLASLSEATSADSVIVAVRGDQLPSVMADVAGCDALTVVCLANPLTHREAFQQQVGTERTVLAFSGIGGRIADDGVVKFHVVRQQPTVVDAAATRGSGVVRLMASTGLPVRSETRFPAWLATHSVFIAGIGSALLASGQGSAGVAGSPRRARELVAAVTEAFDALRRRGHPVRPAALRAIFGRVPTLIAARYWRRQFATPTVRVSIEPHDWPPVTASSRRWWTTRWAWSATTRRTFETWWAASDLPVLWPDRYPPGVMMSAQCDRSPCLAPVLQMVPPSVLASRVDFRPGGRRRAVACLCAPPAS